MAPVVGTPAPDKAFLVIGQGVAAPVSVFGCLDFLTYWIGTARTAVARNVGCKERKAGEIAYNILEVPPGRYELTHSENYSGGIRQTKYAGYSRMSINVAVGETTYLGDLVFNNYYPAQLIEIRRNDDAARAYVASFKLDPDKLRYRALTPGTGDAPETPMPTIMRFL
jgi:hypothetical protein